MHFNNRQQVRTNVKDWKPNNLKVFWNKKPKWLNSRVKTSQGHIYLWKENLLLLLLLIIIWETGTAFSFKRLGSPLDFWCGVYCSSFSFSLLCLFVLSLFCVLSPMLHVFLDCLFFIDPSFFTNIYLNKENILELNYNMNTSRSFSHSWITSGFVTQRVPSVE